MKNKIIILLPTFLLVSCNNSNDFLSSGFQSSEEEVISSEYNKQELNYVVEEWLYNISYIGFDYLETRFINSEEEFNTYNIEYGLLDERIVYENTKFNSSYFEDNILLFFNYGHSSSFENPSIKNMYVVNESIELVYEYETPIMINSDHLKDLVIISLNKEEVKGYLDNEIIITKNEIIIDNDPYTPGNQL